MQITRHIIRPNTDSLHDPATRREAFDQLVGEHLQRLYWYARRLVVRHDEAEDVVQEAFIRAYDKIDTFRGGERELTSWLYRIVTNTALSVLRHKKRNLFCSIDDVSRELAGQVEHNSSEEADQLLIRFQQEVLKLPLKQRLVFNLRYYDQLPYEQIAHILGQDEKTLRVNYHHAEKRLKGQLTRNML